MTTRTRLRRFRRTSVRVLASSCAVGFFIGMIPAGQAGAAPIDDQQAEAQRLEASINDTGTKLAALYEQIKHNQDQLDQANQAIVDANAGIAQAQTQVQNVVSVIRERAVVIYK